LSLGEVVKDGAQTATVDLSGVEDLATGSGSYNLALTPSESGFGEAKEIVTGGSVYVQYAALPALHAKTAAIRTWIVVDSNSGFAIQPSNLTFLTLPEVKLLTNVKSLGRATIGGETDLHRAVRCASDRSKLLHSRCAVANAVPFEEYA